MRPVTPNIDLAREVAKHVALSSVSLKSAHIESFLAPGATLLEPIDITQQHRCSFDEKSIDDKREIHVVAEFKFSASKEAGKDGELVRFEATFVLVYALPAGATYEPRCVQHFAELNGVYNAWPYWREIVHSATGRVGLSGIVLPVYRPVSKQVPDAQVAARAN